MYIFVVGNLNENRGENISVEAMVAVVKVFVKFVWCIGYKWWTVDTYQSYVTDKQSKHSVEIMDSQDQEEVHNERKEPQEEDNTDNTKKGKNDNLFKTALKHV